LALALPFALSPACASDATSASSSGSASASIVQPITVRAIDDLLFGALAVGVKNGGTITVDPASGATTYSGGLQGVCSAASCQAHPAVFGVTGEPGRRYRIAAPASAMARSTAGHDGELPVTDLQIAVASLAGSDPVGLLAADGTDQFRIGGTLKVAAGSAPGFYRAEVSVVVTYD
jgi:hypothetical protein